MKPLHLTLAAGALLSFVGCHPDNAFIPPPPPKVGIQSPVVKDTEIYLEFPGKTQATERVEVRARVRGFLETKQFRSGQYVDKGDLLFTIEPKEFEAAVQSAKGNLNKAVADLGIAKTNYEKLDATFKRSRAVPELDVLAAKATMEAAEANVSIMQAALDNAERDLSYTQIHAPISGRISKNFIDVGNLVGTPDPTLLTTIVEDNPVWVNFEVNERAVLPFLNLRPNHDAKDGLKSRPSSVRLTFSDGNEYAVRGEVDFIDNAINPETGTISVRAKFPNEENLVADGLFVRVGIPEQVEKAVLVPTAAVQRDLGGSFVMVVGDDNVVQRRIVKPTQFTEEDLTILEPYNAETNTGLTAEDRVITNNLQRSRPGLTVEPVDAAEMAVPPPPPPGEADDKAETQAAKKG